MATSGTPRLCHFIPVSPCSPTSFGGLGGLEADVDREAGRVAVADLHADVDSPDRQARVAGDGRAAERWISDADGVLYP